MLGHMHEGLSGVGLIIILVLAVFIIYRFCRKPDMPHSGLDQRDSLEILKKRLASGEITPEEYSKLKSVLLN